MSGFAGFGDYRHSALCIPEVRLPPFSRRKLKKIASHLKKKEKITLHFETLESVLNCYRGYIWAENEHSATRNLLFVVKKIS